MLTFRESLRALRLAQKIVFESAPATGEAAKEYLSLCCRSEGVAEQPDAALFQSLKTKAHPAVPIVLLFTITFLAVMTHRYVMLGFIPAFLFAAYLAWLHREAIDRITPLAN